MIISIVNIVISKYRFDNFLLKINVIVVSMDNFFFEFISIRIKHRKASIKILQGFLSTTRYTGKFSLNVGTTCRY